MDAHSLNELVCQRFCTYYKPSKKEDLACQGFIVIERLIKKGREITFENPAKNAGASTKKRLRSEICPSCPFYKDDCDFIMGKAGSLPCGGFVLLGYLLEAGIVSIDDIENIY